MTDEQYQRSKEFADVGAALECVHLLRTISQIRLKIFGPTGVELAENAL